MANGNEHLLAIILLRGDAIESLKPIVGKRYVLRDISITTDFSLNRCAVETSAFVPDKFKLGMPTPGDENDCTGAHYILSEHLDDQDVVPVNRLNRADYERFGETEDVQNTCTGDNGQGPSTYYATTSQRLDTNIQATISMAGDISCAALNLSPDGAANLHDIEISNARKRHLDPNHDDSIEYEWTTEKCFRFVILYCYTPTLI